MKAPPSFWQLLADRVARDDNAIHIALRNIDQWLAAGHSAPHRLEEWRGLLLEALASPAGRNRLVGTLTGTDAESSRLRDFHPFAGILTREERRHTLELCSYRH